MKKQQNPSWADLNPFLLSKIFGCLSLLDQLFGPPYVCHSWLSASLETLFQNSILDLRLIDTLDGENQRSRFTHLLKLGINQYHGWVSIYFPRKHVFGYFATVFIAEKTPNISSVFWPSDVCMTALPIYVSFFYWQNLRIFRARLHHASWWLVVSQLSEFCKDIVELGIHGKIEEKEMICVVEGFPKLEVLDLSESNLSSKALRIVLNGRLNRLKVFNILHCSFAGEDGKDLRVAVDFMKWKEFKNEMIEKASGSKSLKKFIHCLHKSCQCCKDVS